MSQNQESYAQQSCGSGIGSSSDPDPEHLNQNSLKLKGILASSYTHIFKHELVREKNTLNAQFIRSDPDPFFSGVGSMSSLFRSATQPWGGGGDSVPAFGKGGEIPTFTPFYLGSYRQ